MTVRATMIEAGIRGIEGPLIYWQIDLGDRDDPYRQRLLRFDASADGAIVQQALTPIDPEKVRDLHQFPDRVASLSREDFKETLAVDCEQRWEPTTSDDWRAYVDPGRCRFFSERRQAMRAIESEARLTPDGLWLAERGFDTDGNQVWGTPPGEFTRLKRARP